MISNSGARTRAERRLSAILWRMRVARRARFLTALNRAIDAPAHFTEIFEMAHHKDAIKRIRTSQEARARNRAGRSRMRTQLRDIREKIENGDATAATASLPATMSELQKLARKGVIHRKNAARRISRLAKAIKAIESK